MPRNPCYVASVAFVCAGALLAAAALRAEEPIDWEMVNRIRDEGFHHSQVMETLEHLSDRIGPRLTGSPGMKEANEWTRAKLAEWGLENAHLEPFEFGRGWSFSRTSVHLLKPREMPLFALPEAWTPGTDGPVRGPAVRVGIESEKDFERLRGKLRGKILFLDETRELLPADEEPTVRRHDADDLAELEPFPIPGERGDDGRRARFRRRFELRQKINDFLAEEGALATVEISSRDGLMRVTGGGSRKVDENPGVPALVMMAEHYNWLVRLLDAAAEESEKKKARETEKDQKDERAEGEDGSGGEDAANEDGEDEEKKEEGPSGPGWDEPSPVELEIDVRARFHDDDSMAYNTVAEIPGSGEGLVMVGAHLDSWHTGTGTTDNGAGCAVVMEAVRILKALGVRARRTIRIALWAGEEQGLLGSRHHVEEHFGRLPVKEGQEDRPFFLREIEGEVEVLPAHAAFSAYFNLDNGSGKIRGIYSQENAAAAAVFETWLRPFHDLGASSVVTRNTRGTDHTSFDRVGLPGFQFIQDGLDYGSRTHHTNVDTLDHAVPEDLVQASVVVASFLYHAAMREEPLPRKPMPRYEPRE